MILAFLLPTLLSYAFATSCVCDTQTEPLWVSFGRASEVFLGSIVNVNASSAVVLIESSYKTLLPSLLVTVRFPCSDFQFSLNERVIIFGKDTARINGLTVVQFLGCKRPTLLTTEERSMIEEGSFNCQSATWSDNCNKCTCDSHGRATCSNNVCPPPTNKACNAGNGQRIPDGSAVFFSDRCTSCSCHSGTLTCRPVSGCKLNDDTNSPPSSSTPVSRSKPLGISLTSVVFILLLGVIVVVLVRKRMAKQSGEHDIVLEDVDEPDNNNNNNTNTNGYSVAAYPTNNFQMATMTTPYPATTFPTASYNPQQFSFAPVSPGGWNGQPMATVPVVMMTQNGEPVLTQVAYV